MLIYVCFIVGGVSAALVHPGVTVTRAELDTIKSRVAKNIQPQLQGYNKLKGDSRSSLTYSPNPVAIVDVGANNSPRTGYDAVLNDATAANAQAYLWYITGDDRYAKNVMAILQAHANNLQEIKNHNRSIFAGWTGKGFAKAAEILKHTYSGWNDQIERDVIALFDRVFIPLVNPTHVTWQRENTAATLRNNWSTIMYDTWMCIAIFKNDEEDFRRAADYMLQSIEWFLFPNGECVETGRDLQHVQMGISAIARAAETAWKQGIDLYSHLDNRLLTAFEFQAKYVLQGGSPTCTDCGLYPALGTMDFTRTNKVLNQAGMPYEASRGAAWEVIYNHYHNRMGLAAPRTKAMVDDIRSRGWVGWAGRIAGMGTILHANMHTIKPARPFVQFTSPVRKPEEYETYMWRRTGDTLTMEVRASAYQGTVASVKFYANGNLVGTVTSSPYRFTWQNIPAGTHALKAVVTDGNGITQEAYSAVKVSSTPADIILHAVYSDQAVITGSWIGVTQPDHLNHYGYNYIHDRNSGTDPSKNVAFTPDIAVEGRYHVYLSWKPRTDAPAAAPLEIKHAGGTDNSKTVNQQRSAEWNYIGTYAFGKGKGSHVKILASQAGYTTANACKLVYVKETAPVFTANCGKDSDYTAHDGTVYRADSKYSGGQSFASGDQVQRTNDIELYQHFRYSSTSFSYDIPVANGYYEVTLKFSEHDWIWPGQRRYDISAEGVLVCNKLDIAHAMQLQHISGYGAYKGKAYDYTFPVDVRDGELNLEFKSVSGRVVVNGILVTAMDDSPSAKAGEAIAPRQSLLSMKTGAATRYTLRFFDLQGKETMQSAGLLHALSSAQHTGNRLSAGTYLYELTVQEAGNRQTVRGRFTAAGEADIERLVIRAIR